MKRKPFVIVDLKVQKQPEQLVSISVKRGDYHELLKTTKLSTFLLISHDIILFDEKLHLKCRRDDEQNSVFGMKEKK